MPPSVIASSQGISADRIDNFAAAGERNESYANRQGIAALRERKNHCGFLWSGGLMVLAAGKGSSAIKLACILFTFGWGFTLDMYPFFGL